MFFISLFYLLEDSVGIVIIVSTGSYTDSKESVCVTQLPYVMVLYVFIVNPTCPSCISFCFNDESMRVIVLFGISLRSPTEIDTFLGLSWAVPII